MHIQNQGEVSRSHDTTHIVDVCKRLDIWHPCLSRLFRSLACNGLPAMPTSINLGPGPPHYAAVRREGNDDISTQLSHHFDRSIAPVTLGQGLDDDDARTATGLNTDGVKTDPQ